MILKSGSLIVHQELIWLTCLITWRSHCSQASVLVGWSQKFELERLHILERFLNVLTVHVSPQNATNGDKSFEALLSHTIGELSKGDGVYRANTEETSMVRRLCTSSHSTWVGVEEGCITGIISELSCQLLIGPSCCFHPLGSWSPVCGPRSPSSSACSSPACPSCASPACCSTTCTETYSLVAWYVALPHPPPPSSHC